ncbi:MAG: ATP-binding protein [Lachnospiraceae bacterium]|nr:ATP-binding protein [Lachnospiraceae bacterium]
MNKFIDREAEITTLQTEYERSGSSLVILYGRRRVGKTTLITEFIKDKTALFFLASEESEVQNRNLFKEKAAEFTNNELLKNVDIRSWDTIFKVITNTPFALKPVIVIDEFQYIGKSNPAFPSIFQRIWEEQLKNSSIMVILCGSLISMMESQTLSYHSPLYGRRTAQIRLKQIPFRYYQHFFSNKTRKELIEMYAITGGVPKYIESFSESRDIFQSIQTSILNPSGYLYNEPYFLLQQEVTEIGSYFSIIRAIAAGNSRLSTISKVLEIKTTSLTKYLKVLIDLDILKREVPITEENPEKSKRGLYKITDNYIRFWFAFVYPNMSFLESGNSGIVMDKIHKGLVKNHISFVYEDVCIERMWELNADGCWPFYFTKIGRWWDKENEIDIVALDPDGNNLILGECKYWKEPVGITIFQELEKKAENVNWQKNNRQVWYVIFSASGFTDTLKQLASGRSDLLLFDEKD